MKKFAFLVIMDVGGIFGIYWDMQRALDAAQAINGAVFQLGTIEEWDFRK